MTPEEIRKLLGGYGTGNLTAGEQQALFAAALEDQELFDALAGEQTLRDLLSDPATRGELLAALDRPTTASGGFWQWLRRPMVAGLVTAGVAGIGILAVWRMTQPAAPDRVLVAEVKPPQGQPAATAQRVPETPARTAGPAAAEARPKVQERVSNGPAAARSDKAAGGGADYSRLIAPPPPPPMAAPPPPTPKALSASARDEKDTVVPNAEKKKESASATAESVVTTGSVGGVIGGVIGGVPLDARAIFYLNQPAAGANAFVQPAAPSTLSSGRGGRGVGTGIGAGMGGGGGADPPPARQSAPAQTLASPQTTPAALPAQLGVRVSVLRADQEVDPGTELAAGESVRLKVVANADGYLRVAEGPQTIANAAVQRLKPFETPALTLEGASPKQLTITFSRMPLPDALSLDAATRGNLVEQGADQGLATYVVSAAPQMVVPVTLRFR